MSFEVIRVSSDYQVVILIDPPGAKPEDADKTVYEHNGYISDNDEGDYFTDISTHAALGYFSGQADGMGWGEIPAKPFDTLAEAEEWARMMQKQIDDELEAEAEAFLKEHGIEIPKE